MIIQLFISCTFFFSGLYGSFTSVNLGFFNEQHINKSVANNIFEAAERGLLGSLQQFILNGVDVGIKSSKDGSTALHLAAENGHYLCMEALLKKQSDPLINIRNNNCAVALHNAIIRGDINCIKLLIDNKADINVQDADLNTPLHLAIGLRDDNARLNILELLYKKGAQCNLKNKKGETPLHLAAELSQGQSVKFLVRSEEDCESRRDEDGKTALEILNVYNEADGEKYIKYLPESVTKPHVTIDRSGFSGPTEVSRATIINEDALIQIKKMKDSEFRQALLDAKRTFFQAQT